MSHPLLTISGMTFAACSLNRPMYSRQTARRQAAAWRLRGLKAAEAVVCPFGAGLDQHWHVCTVADDPLLAGLAVDRSEAMADGFRRSGGY